jgi:hypothetical protein
MASGASLIVSAGTFLANIRTLDTTQLVHESPWIAAHALVPSSAWT